MGWFSWLNPKESGPRGEVRALHKFDDVDAHDQAHHHTLGPGVFQAARGSHKHLDTSVIEGSLHDGTMLYELLRVLEREMGLVFTVKDSDVPAFLRNKQEGLK